MHDIYFCEQVCFIELLFSDYEKDHHLQSILILSNVYLLRGFNPLLILRTGNVKKRCLSIV